MIIKPKGTLDILGDDAVYYNFIQDVINYSMKINNIEYIRTPIFEASDLFHRSVGEDSDIVSKETYNFKDRGDRSITLRPEGTACVARSVVENKLYGNRNDLIKYYYFGTMYRYERPQAGRFREFTQFGIEAFNSNEVKVDAEIINVGYQLFGSLGFDLEDITVSINSLGDNESRENYTKALKEYIKPYLNDLCDDCKKRYETNPLRILDCKIDKDSEVFKNLPIITEYLSNSSKIRLEELEKLLMLLDVNYEVNPNIVRGLDYYTEFVYEFLDDNGLALGGGGRYNNLVKSLEGPDMPATGFALGIDRIINYLKNKIDLNMIKKDIDVFVMAISEEEKLQSLIISNMLRSEGISVENNFNDLSLKSQFKLVEKYNPRFVIILNDEDLKLGLINIKDNATKEEEKIDETDIVDYLNGNL